MHRRAGTRRWKRSLRSFVRAGRCCRRRCSGAGANSRSEQQERPRSERRRGRQPGAAGHGRTLRPALEERTEERNPPAEACVCGRCGKPYVANGAEVSTIVEIEVSAHKRVIRRPRWRRRCDCASSPTEVSAPPAPRLFAGTPCGTSVWARFRFERYACFRPLRRVASWLSGQGLPISPGTLGDSARRCSSRWLPRSSPARTRRRCAMVMRLPGACSRFARRAARAGLGCGPRSARTRSTSTLTPRAVRRSRGSCSERPASIDPLRWLEAWLAACAERGGRAPEDLSPWLPWSMGAERRRALMVPG